MWPCLPLRAPRSDPPAPTSTFTVPPLALPCQCSTSLSLDRYGSMTIAICLKQTDEHEFVLASAWVFERNCCYELGSCCLCCAPPVPHWPTSLREILPVLALEESYRWHAILDDICLCFPLVIFATAYSLMTVPVWLIELHVIKALRPLC